MDSMLPGIITFGILLAIAVFGFMTSSASAARLHGSDPTRYDTNGRRDDTSRMSDIRA